MNLDDAAKKLGYFDADHVEKNVEAYGEPLIEWWSLIKELVNELPLNDVSYSVFDHETIERIRSSSSDAEVRRMIKTKIKKL